jgi:putative membrane protein
MLVEALLAYAHFAAILTLVVFMTSLAALCRTEWLNAAVVRRLVRVDRIYWAALLVVGLTGLARMVWGIKGLGWYASQPLLLFKLALFVVIGVIALKPTRLFMRWQQVLDETGCLPDAHEITLARRRVMIEAHLLLLLPLAAVFVARGLAGPG